MCEAVSSAETPTAAAAPHTNSPAMMPAPVATASRRPFVRADRSTRALSSPGVSVRASATRANVATAVPRVTGEWCRTGAARPGGPGEDQWVTPTPTTDEWGIDASWLDALDEEHSVAQVTIDRLREVIGTPPADLEERAPIVGRPGDVLEVDEADVVCEDG